MKRASRNKCGELRSEYDFASMKGGVRGKYAARTVSEANLVLLDDDVASAFPTAAAVNEALRALMRAAACICPGRGRGSQRARRTPRATTRPK
jgi:hypothetical protein